VRFEERIKNMQDQNIINAAQADDMLAHLHPVLDQDGDEASSTKAYHSSRRQWSMGKMAAGTIFTVLGVFMIINGGGDQNDVTPEVIQNVSQALNQGGEVGLMDKSITTGMSILVILLPIVLSVLAFVYLYNNLVEKEEEVFTSWSQVESNYQRRADFVPNLVESVKTYVAHEEKILLSIAERRQAAMGAMEDMSSKLEDSAALADFSQAQSALQGDIVKLFGLAEDYPDLRSADNFLALQDQLEGAENRINISRIAFNESVKDFNSAMRKMPGSVIAAMGKFKRKAYFEAKLGTEDAVQLGF
jgi:LemA protein